MKEHDVTQLYHYLLLSCCRLVCLVKSRGTALLNISMQLFNSKTAVRVTSCTHIFSRKKHWVHVHRSSVFNTQFNIFFSSLPNSFEESLSFVLGNQNAEYISCVSHECHMSCASHSLFHDLHVIRCRVCYLLKWLCKCILGRVTE